MIRSSRLLAEQRQELIYAELAEHGAVRTIDLASKMNVAAVTIRRDLAELEQRGLAALIHGGARLPGGSVPPSNRRERSTVEVDAKRAIAAMAAAQLQDGDAVFLDSGTTCAAMVPGLAERRALSVVTTDLATASELACAAPHVSVIVAGGLIDNMTLSTGGELLLAALQSFAIDTAFVSASAWDAQSGATTGGLGYASVKRAALSRAKRAVLIADSSKYGASEIHVVRALADFDAVITDGGLADAQRRAVRAAGVDLFIAER